MDQDVPLGLTLDEVKTLDQVRMRLSQLTHSMQSLAQSVYASNPLPDPASLQAFHNVLQKNLESLNTVLAENAYLFSRVAVHPSTNFDGRKYEGVLLGLLRKKLETAAEIWADEGRAAAVEAVPDTIFPAQSQHQQLMTAAEREDAEKRRMQMHWQEQDDLADRVRGVFTEHIKEYIQSEEPSLFTREEKERGIPLERVRTGLRRDLVREEKAMFEDEEDDDDEDVAMGMGVGMENVGVGEQQWQQQQQQWGHQQQGQMGQMGQGQGQQQGAMPGSTTIVPEQMFWFGVKGDIELPPMVDKVGSRVVKKAGPGPLAM